MREGSSPGGPRASDAPAAREGEQGEGPIPVGDGMAERVGLVDDDKIAGLTARRPDDPYAESFVRDDGCVEDAVAVQYRAPLGDKHRRYDEAERLLVLQC